MPKCMCYHCKNRAVGCHKFCSDYRAYRRALEAVQAAEKKEKESSVIYMRSMLRDRFKRK